MDKKIDPILNLTLEIIYLRTGEDYMIVKKPSDPISPSSSNQHVSESFSRMQSPRTVPLPYPLVHEKNNEQKILELTNKIIELLTREVPIRCEDVTVYFSLEEWEYIEGHKHLYNDIMIENQQHLGSDDGYIGTNKKRRRKSPIFFPDYLFEEPCVIKSNVRERCLSICKPKEMYHISGRNMTGDSPLCNKSNLMNPKISIHTEHPFGYIHEIPASCKENNLTDIYIVTDHAQTEYPSTHIKEEPASCEEGNLTDISTPIEHPQTQYPSIPIKEEPVLCEEGNPTDISKPTEHPQTQYPSIPIKEEPVLCEEGNLTDISKPTVHPQTQYPSIPFKEEPVLCEEENLTDISKPTEHPQTQYPSIPFKEEPVLCEEVNFGNIYTSMDYRKPEYPFCVKEHIKMNRNYQNNDMLIQKCNEIGNNGILKTEPTSYQMVYKSEFHKNEIQEGEKQFSCSECGKCFGQKKDLNRHQQSHLGRKPFSCPECLKGFTQSSNLITHQRIHTGEKPFSCYHCGKCFAQKSDLNRHLKIHSGVKPFSCSECGKCFTLNAYLVTHQRIHTGEKPFSCWECGKCFGQKSVLNRHLRIHRKEANCFLLMLENLNSK
ncbi:gastrula zinc finger protein XlCGF53.1-like [Pelobates fuscus]|uniref:gastrula zinc finger protein XlCGF53.1-like n=1 Tax=Pelobates fuscus TaxID=191477 RepID=UPI002FE4FA5E